MLDFTRLIIACGIDLSEQGSLEVMEVLHRSEEIGIVSKEDCDRLEKWLDREILKQ